MRCIFKYHISYSAETTKIEMPISSKIISVGLDPQGDLCIWAIVDPEEGKSMREFAVVGTGWPMKDSLEYWTFLGTVKQGPYMWHVFEI